MTTRTIPYSPGTKVCSFWGYGYVQRYNPYTREYTIWLPEWSRDVQLPATQFWPASPARSHHDLALALSSPYHPNGPQPPEDFDHDWRDADDLPY